MQRLLLFVVTVLFAGMQAAFAVQPTWAKKATEFPEQCYPGKTQACQPVRIPAPDGKSSVEVRYREKFDGDWILQAYLRVTPRQGHPRRGFTGRLSKYRSSLVSGNGIRVRGSHGSDSEANRR